MATRKHTKSQLNTEGVQTTASMLCTLQRSLKLLPASLSYQPLQQLNVHGPVLPHPHGIYCVVIQWRTGVGVNENRETATIEGKPRDKHAEIMGR